MFVSFKDLYDEDIEQHIEKQLGRFVAITGNAPNSIEMSIEDFGKIRNTFLVTKTIQRPEESYYRNSTGFYLTGSGIEVLIH